MPQKEIMPEASKALTYGVLGNALAYTFFIPVLGIAASITSLIFAIIALRTGRECMARYREDKSRWEGSSFGKSLAGFILGIAGIPTSIIMIIYSIVFTAFMSEIFR